MSTISRKDEFRGEIGVERRMLKVSIITDRWMLTGSRVCGHIAGGA